MMNESTLPVPAPEEAYPLITVIVPTYNAGDYIADTVSSALMQSYPNKEVIVVDDGSTDDTEAVVRRLCASDSRVQFVKLPRNFGGPAWGRNLGVSMAKGSYLAFLDADDLWHPQKLELQMEAMHRYDVPFVSTELLAFDEGRMAGLRAMASAAYELSSAKIDRITHRRLLCKNLIANSSVLIRKDAFDRIHFSEDRALVAVEDYECWLKLHQEMSHSVRLRLPLLYYRVCPGSISRAKLRMLKRVNRLLKGYSVAGKPLGWSRYFYLCTYAGLSLWSRLVR